MSDARVQIFGGGPVLPIEAFAANVTPQANNYTILIDATAGNRTVTLPLSANFPGRIYAIKRTDSSGNSVTVAASGSDTIDGVATLSLTATMGAILQSDGEGLWSVISSSSSGGGGPATPKAATFVVDVTPGLGDFTTIEAAVAATPVTGADIYVREGAYAPVGTIALPAARNVKIRGAGRGIVSITAPTTVPLFSVAGGATAEYKFEGFTVTGDDSLGQSLISIGAAVDVTFSDVQVTSFRTIVATTSTPEVLFENSKYTFTTFATIWSFWNGTAGGKLIWNYVETTSVTQSTAGIVGTPDWDIVDSYIGGAPLITVCSIGKLTILGMKADKINFVVNSDDSRIVNLEAIDAFITVQAAIFSIENSQLSMPTLGFTQLSFSGAGGAGGVVQNTVSGCVFNGNGNSSIAIDVLDVQGVDISGCVIRNHASEGIHAIATSALSVTGCRFTETIPVLEGATTVVGRYTGNTGFSNSTIVGVNSVTEGFRRADVTAGATTDVLVTVFTHTNDKGLAGAGAIKNTGANSLTVRRTVTDAFGVSDFQEDPVLSGATLTWPMDSAIGAAVPSYTIFTVSVKSTVVATPTTYDLHHASVGAY